VIDLKIYYVIYKNCYKSYANDNFIKHVNFIVIFGISVKPIIIDSTANMIQSECFQFMKYMIEKTIDMISGSD